MASNANTPAIPCYVRNSFLLPVEHPKYLGATEAYMLSIRCLYGQAPQFNILLDTGAIFTGLPAHSICFRKDAMPIELPEAQLYDAVGSDIEVFVMETLQYAKCTVKCTSGQIRQGKYLFTLDFVGNTGLSRDPYNWKQMHCIESSCGNLLIYPQYRVKILDMALAPRCEEDFPSYQANEKHWMVEV